MIRVGVAAPALALRTGLAALLDSQPGIQVVAQASAWSDLLPPFDELDVLVLAPGSFSIPEVEPFSQAGPAALLFIVSDDVGMAGAAASRLAGRAWGFLPVDSTAEDLHAAVAALAQGLIVGDPALIRQDLLRLVGGNDMEPEPGSEAEPLTERENQVLQLLAQGLANKQIAVRLGISEHTVKFHTSSIYAKLNATSRTEAVRLGVRRGWVSL